MQISGVTGATGPDRSSWRRLWSDGSDWNRRNRTAASGWCHSNDGTAWGCDAYRYSQQRRNRCCQDGVP